MSVACAPEPPPGCTVDPESVYFRDLDAIHDEMRSLAAELRGVDVYAPGPNTLNGNEVLAIQFGPTQVGAIAAPALLVTGTIHAQEWFGTAVAQEWMRKLADAVRVPESSPELSASLQHSAVIVVPVANPDGYAFTRSTDRGRRGNMNVLPPPGSSVPLCSGGVDINRNFPVAFEESTGGCGANNYPGAEPGSEPETQNLIALMNGSAFSSEVGAADVVAVVDFHSNAGDARVTNGYKATTDAYGPQCMAGFGTSFCANPEYPLYSVVFGDSASPAWADPIGGGHLPFEHSWVLQSYIGGTFRLYATMRQDGPRALGLLVELPDRRWGFNAECRTDVEIRSVASAQIIALTRATSYLPELQLARTGTSNLKPMGQAVREWSESSSSPVTEGESRMSWLYSVPPSAVPPLIIEMNGEPDVALEPWRPGSFYNLYSYRPQTHGRDPLNWPCCFRIRDQQGVEDVTTCATVCADERIDLCDPARVMHSGWDLTETSRAGTRDCFFTPTEANGELVIPSRALSGDVAWEACYAHFSLDADSSIPDLALSFERERLDSEGTGSGEYETMQRVSFDPATSIALDTGSPLTSEMRSFSYPVALSPLPWAAGFRIVSTGLPPELFAGALRISDLVVTCIGQ